MAAINKTKIIIMSDCPIGTATSVYSFFMLMAVLVSLIYLTFRSADGEISWDFFAFGLVLEIYHVIIYLMGAKYDPCLNWICLNLGACS